MKRVNYPELRAAAQDSLKCGVTANAGATVPGLPCRRYPPAPP